MTSDDTNSCFYLCKDLFSFHHTSVLKTLEHICAKVKSRRMIWRENVDWWLIDEEYWVVFSEDLGSIPSTNVATHDHLQLSFNGLLHTCLTFWATKYTHVHKYAHSQNTHTQQSSKIWFLKWNRSRKRLWTRDEFVVVQV